MTDFAGKIAGWRHVTSIEPMSCLIDFCDVRATPSINRVRPQHHPEKNVRSGAKKPRSYGVEPFLASREPRDALCPYIWSAVVAHNLVLLARLKPA